MTRNGTARVAKSGLAAARLQRRKLGGSALALTALALAIVTGCSTSAEDADPGTPSTPSPAAPAPTNVAPASAPIPAKAPPAEESAPTGTKGGALGVPGGLIVEQTLLDLGTVKRGTKSIAAFNLRNESDRDIRLTEVRPTCGCTTERYDEVIPAGGKGEVLLTFDSNNMSGIQTKKAYVTTDDPEMPNFQLLFRAEVEGSMFLRPSASARMSNRRPSLMSRTVLVQRDVGLDQQLDLTEVTPGHDWYTVEAVKLTETHHVPGESYIGRAGDWLLKFEYGEAPPFGWNDSEVTMKTGLPDEPELSVGVRIENVPPVTLSEDTIELPRSGPSQTTVLLSVRRELDPKKLKVSSEARGVDLQLVQAGPRHFKLQVDWDGKPLRGSETIVFVYEGIEYPIPLAHSS